MTDEEHYARAMLLGGDAVRLRNRRLARVYLRGGQFAGTAIYRYIDVESLEIFINERSEFEAEYRQFNDV